MLRGKQQPSAQRRNSPRTNRWYHATPLSASAALAAVLIVLSCHGSDPFGFLKNDTEGDKLSRTHADGSRWSGQNPKSGPPVLALLWFRGDYEAFELEVYSDGWSTSRSARIFEKTSSEQHLDSELFSALTNMVRSLPVRSDSSERAYELVRVSWREGSQWVSRTYSRTSPPELLVKMFRLLGRPLDFICKTLPESKAADVKEFSGPVRFQGASCDRGLLLAGQSKVLLLDAYQSGTASYFPAPPVLTNWLYAVAITPAGDKMALATENVLSLHEVKSAQELWRQALSHDSLPSHIALAPDASKLLVSSHNRLFLYSTLTRADPKLLALSGEEVGDLAWAADGRWIASASDQYVRLWDASGNILCTFTNSGTVSCLSFSRDSTTLAVGASSFQDIQVYDLAKRALAFEIPCATERYNSITIEPCQLAWSADGSFLALRGRPGPVILCDVRKHAPVAFAAVNLSSPVAFDRTGVTLIAVGTDNTIHKWPLKGVGSSR